MPRHAPPPYAGERCKNATDGEQHDLDITRKGTYYGLCSFCRRKEADRRRDRRVASLPPRSLESSDRDLDGMRDEITARSSQRPKLRAACEELVVVAGRLQDAIDDRDAATLHARVVVAEFKDALQVVGRTAQSMLNGSNGNGNH